MRADAGSRHSRNGSYTRKLTLEDVRLIQERHQLDGWTFAQLAAEHGVSYQAIAYHCHRPPERDVTLDWLRKVPGYRELIRQRVSDAAKRAEALSDRIDRQHVDRDYLGREVDGCG